MNSFIIKSFILVKVDLEFVPETLVTRRQDTLNRMSVHLWTLCIHLHILISHLGKILSSQFTYLHVFWEGRGKLENLEETHKQRENKVDRRECVNASSVNFCNFTTMQKVFL